jgi:uncharacterized protein (TIRG00374 family)
LVNKKSQQVLLLVSISFLVLFGVIVIVLDRKAVTEVIGQANWHMAPLALPFTVISYFLTGYSFLLISRIFGVKLGKWDLIEIGYVTNALDNLLPGAGLPGTSLRVLILKRRELDTDRAISVSLFRSHFNNLIFISLLPVALIFLLFSHSLNKAQAIGIIVAIIFIVIVIIAGVIVVFKASFRSWVLKIISRTWRLFTKHDISSSLDSFGKVADYGIQAMEGNLWILVRPVAVIIGAWFSNVTILWICFIALGSYVNFGVVLTGFIIGRTVGVISFLPGGLGTQDASTVGVYATYGVPLAQGALAYILFRVIYYFIPFVISLGFYRRLLRS